jgi:bla regulator protein blaR1
MPVDGLNPLMQQLGLTLLHFVWQGALIGLLFGLGLLILRRTSAATRYSFAVSTLAVLAALPVLTFFYLGSMGTGPSAGPVDSELSTLMLTARQGMDSSVLPGLLVWVVLAWLAGVVVMSLRLLIGWRYVQRLRRGADALAARHLQPILERLKRQMAVNRSVRLAISTQVGSPVVVGWLKPLILFPPAVVNHLPMAQLEMVLAHELAHIRRHDHLINLFQTVTETLLFYHPVVAWVSRRIRVEREHACDDLAVASTDNRLAYVEMLATLERIRYRGPRLALAVHDGQILGRIRRLIEQARPHQQRGLTLPVILLISLLAGAAGLKLMPEADHNLVEAQVSALDLPLAQGTETAPGSDSADLVAPASAPVVPDPPAAIEEVPTSEVLATQPESTPPGPEDVIEPLRIESSSVPDDALSSPATPLSVTRPAAAPLELAAIRRPAPSEPNIEQVVTADLLPLSGGELLHRVEPDFPDRALRRRAEGVVELAFTVTETGQVRDIEVLQETPAQWQFGEAARQAVAQWRFEPFRRGDEHLSRQVRLEVVFDPDQACQTRIGSRIPRC